MTATNAKYPTEPVKCWGKAKELRREYYENYVTAHEKGALRWSGGALGIEAVPAGLGRDVYPMTGEPYGASVAFDKAFAAKCHEAAEQAGYARDLCAYMRNYWGSMLLGEWAFGGEFPEPDFYWQFHGCCSHGKWYQEASKIGGHGIPMLAHDLGSGLYWEKDEATGVFVARPRENRVRYLADQQHESIEKLEGITGRPFDDELLIEAAYNYFENTTIWPEICVLNQAVPAPLDEKSMFSLYVFGALNKCSAEFVSFYKELRDEVKDRVARGIAAVPNERARLLSDIQPPWGFLKIWRYLEQYGCVSVGSIYTDCLMSAWQIEEDGTLKPRITPQQQGITIKDRDHCLMLLSDWLLSNFWCQTFQEHTLKSFLMQKMYEQWHCDGVLIHYNRGCEGLSLGVAENRLYLVEQGIPVLPYEGNMGDEREFDLAETTEKINAFMESLGLEIIEGVIEET
jgi:benzoyl-CoA reductase subunit B